MVKRFHMIHTGDYRDFTCPDAALLLTDPPYGIGKVYNGKAEGVPFPQHVREVLQWSRTDWTLVLGPMSTLRGWLAEVPEPHHLLWWHRTFLLPGRRMSFYAPSLTPILVYRGPSAVWYGPSRQDRNFHDVIDASSNMGDITRLRSLGITLPKHPALTGTSLPKKIIPCLTTNGDLVVDPFAGCGSILVSALRLGREVWGCEIEQPYADAANQWIEKERQLVK